MKEHMSNFKVSLSLMRFANQTKGSIILNITFLLFGTLFVLSGTMSFAPIGGIYFAMIAMFIVQFSLAPMATDLCRMSYRRRAVMTKSRCLLSLISNLIMGALYIGIVMISFKLNPERINGMIASSEISMQFIAASLAFFILGFGVTAAEKWLPGLIILIVLLCGVMVGGLAVLHYQMIPPMHIGVLAAILGGSILLTFILESILSYAFYYRDDLTNSTRSLSMSGANN